MNCPSCGRDLREGYGIEGPKWGLCRFQNADGSLNDEGKKRYECPENDSE